MALTKIDTTVTNIADISKSLVIDTTVNGIRKYVDVGLDGKANLLHSHDGTYVRLNGDTMLGKLTLNSSPPTADWHAAPKKYVDDSIASATNSLLTLTTADGRYVKITGGTMTGRLTLSADPTDNLHAVTKQYLENNINFTTQTIWIPAGAMISRLTNGATYGINETTTNYVVRSGLDFVHDTNKYVQFQVVMRKGWNGGALSASFYWDNLTSISGDVVWAIQGQIRSDLDAIDQAFGSPVSVVDSCSTTADRFHQSSEVNNLTLAGVGGGEKIATFQVYRDATNPVDTSTATVRLLGVKLKYTTMSLTDA